MAKIRRHGKWSSYQLHTQESAPERPNLKVYTSDDSTVFWACIYKMKPGCRLYTNGKNYIFKSILVKRGNGVKREYTQFMIHWTHFLHKRLIKQT